MNDTMQYPFATTGLAERARIAKEAKERADASEKMHVDNLMHTESGLWILRLLVETFEREVTWRAIGDGEYALESAYHRGKQDAVREYRDLVIKHFGHSGLDKILKGK